MTPASLAAAIAGLFVALFLAGLITPPRDPIAELRARYLELSRLTRADAKEQLAARIEALTQKFPGKTYLWYLRWLVRDLERAKD